MASVAAAASAAVLKEGARLELRAAFDELGGGSSVITPSRVCAALAQYQPEISIAESAEVCHRVTGGSSHVSFDEFVRVIEQMRPVVDAPANRTFSHLLGLSGSVETPPTLAALRDAIVATGASADDAAAMIEPLAHLPGTVVTRARFVEELGALGYFSPALASAPATAETAASS